MTTPLDTQQIEILGRGALTAALVGDGLEVARPERDTGIDLLAFSLRPWKVVPIQMKAATGAVFSIDRKYENVDSLVMVYVWNARSATEVEFYAIPWQDAIRVADGFGWTETASWKTGGRYATSRPTARVRAAIAGYRTEPGGWRRLMLSA
jgi:hypothetical protein